jgi:hypothetical protein
MLRRFTLSALFALLLSAAGCGADAQNDPEPVDPLFSQLHSGDHVESGMATSKQAQVFTNQADYEAALARYTSSSPANIDFSTSRVLLVAMGQRPTGGYGIRVSSVEPHARYVVANVILSVPGEDCAVTEVITNPYQFVQIQTTDDVLVQEQLVVDVCN